MKHKVGKNVSVINSAVSELCHANDVTRYHDYASGSHRGASRTKYSLKWPLAIGMHCCC